MYRGLGNMIHFPVLKMQIFPHSQKIIHSKNNTIPKHNAVSYYETEKQNFFSAAVKNNLSYAKFDKDSFVAAACTLKLQVINPNYLRKLC